MGCFHCQTNHFVFVWGVIGNVILLCIRSENTHTGHYVSQWKAANFTVWVWGFSGLYLELPGSVWAWPDSQPFAPSPWCAGPASGTAARWTAGPKPAAHTPSSSCDPEFPENSRSEGRRGKPRDKEKSVRERFSKRGKTVFFHSADVPFILWEAGNEMNPRKEPKGIKQIQAVQRLNNMLMNVSAVLSVNVSTKALILSESMFLFPFKRDLPWIAACKVKEQFSFNLIQFFFIWRSFPKYNQFLVMSHVALTSWIWITFSIISS